MEVFSHLNEAIFATLTVTLKEELWSLSRGNTAAERVGNACDDDNGIVDRCADYDTASCLRSYLLLVQEHWVVLLKALAVLSTGNPYHPLLLPLVPLSCLCAIAHCLLKA